MVQLLQSRKEGNSKCCISHKILYWEYMPRDVNNCVMDNYTVSLSFQDTGIPTHSSVRESHRGKSG